MSLTKFFSALLMVLLFTACASMGDGSKTEKQQAILKMESEVLTKLYAERPDVRAQIQAASGYAVFSSANVNVLFVAAGTGYGVVKNNNTGEQVYMNMAEVGVGLGLGLKDYRLIMVFHSAEALNHFVERGWSVGGNADVTAKAADRGVSLENEAYAGLISVYTITEAGLALQATIKGLKFWQDSQLN